MWTQYQQDYENTGMFYEAVSEKLILFDPLDRAIKNGEGEDQGTKSAELKKKITELPKIDRRTTELRAPLSARQYDQLEQLFDQERRSCAQVEQNFLDDAKRANPQITKPFGDHEWIRRVKDLYEFFAVNQLTLDSQERATSFEQYIQHIQEEVGKLKEEAKAQQRRGETGKVEIEKQLEDARRVFEAPSHQLLSCRSR